MEVEAIALSRDIPVAVRWLVNPIVRRISRNSMLISLQQTKDAVRMKEDANRHSQSPTATDNHSRGAVAPGTTFTNSFDAAAKPLVLKPQLSPCEAVVQLS